MIPRVLNIAGGSPCDRVVADASAAVLVLGERRFIVRTAAELEVACSQVLAHLPPLARAGAIEALGEGWRAHIDALCDRVLRSAELAARLSVPEAEDERLAAIT